jgi:dTDP-4-amino-4,6-dideoxygalactose transaminase
MGPCGTRSTVSILSFHPRKTLTTCEGGAVVTADLDIAHRVRLLRNHGMDGQGLDRRFVHPGYNARLSEVHAAVGLAQIPHLDDYLERRQQCCRRYIRRLADIPDITIPDGFRQPGNSYQSFVVLLPPHRSRNAAIAALADKGIEATIPGFAIHEQPAFTGLTRQSASLSTSSALAAHGLALPIHERLSLEDVDRVADALCASLAH